MSAGEYEAPSKAAISRFMERVKGDVTISAEVQKAVEVDVAARDVAMTTLTKLLEGGDADAPQS